MNLLIRIVKFFRTRVFLDKNEKNYIKHNLIKWKKYNKKDRKNVILVDLFQFYPWLNFYSYLVNVLAIKYDATPKFFYFNLYQGRLSKIRLFISKIKKLYESFNVTEGISEYNFSYSKNEIAKYSKAFEKLNYQKKKLLKYKFKKIIIGDLIYDTYLRIKYMPTLDMKNDLIKKIFFRAHKIFNEIEIYFHKNNIKCLIPSHVCYISYGIISRIAAKKKIPIVKIFQKNRGNASFRLLKVDKNEMTEEAPYFNYKKTFSKFSNIHKNKAIKKGQKIIKKRISGNFDSNLPNMTLSSFNNKFRKINFNNNFKKKIILFPHCYFDNPHRYRHMLFEDFYEQIKFFLDFSKKNQNYQWFYKPHPNEITLDLNVHSKILKDYPDVVYLDKDTSHHSIIKLQPECVVTNHGTIAHEYAYFKIPVINTGDNPHINYEFCFHVKSKSEIIRILNNLNYYKKKLNFDKKKLYEFMYLHFEYFPFLNNEKKYLDDSYFAYKNIKKNNSSILLNKFTKQSKLINNNIKKYVEKYVEKNL